MEYASKEYSLQPLKDIGVPGAEWYIDSYTEQGKWCKHYAIPKFYNAHGAQWTRGRLARFYFGCVDNVKIRGKFVG